MTQPPEPVITPDDAILLKSLLRDYTPKFADLVRQLALSRNPPHLLRGSTPRLASRLKKLYDLCLTHKPNSQIQALEWSFLLEDLERPLKEFDEMPPDKYQHQTTNGLWHKLRLALGLVK